MENVDAPAYRVWPPVALGVPLLAGLGLSTAPGDPFTLPAASSRVVGTALVVAFAVWNGWALLLMGRHRTALLPGGATTTVLASGSFRVSRNPLYVGLVGLALLAGSAWALLLVPVGVAALLWGAVLPEERYLTEVFGAEYETSRARVRRWL